MTTPISHSSPRAVNHTTSEAPKDAESSSCWCRGKKKKDIPIVTVEPTTNPHTDKELHKFSVDYTQIIKEQRDKEKKEEKKK